MKEETKTTNLLDFNWDDKDTWFGVEDKTKTTSDIIEEVKKTPLDDKDTDEKVEPEKEPEVEPEVEEDFFEEEEDSTKVPDSKEDDDNLFSNLAKDLKEKNIFSSVEVTDDETEDSFFEKFGKEIDNRVDGIFEDFFESLDQDAVAFLKHKKEGGVTSDFFKVYGQSSMIPKLDNLESDTEKEKVIRYYLQNHDAISEEDIDSRVQWLKDQNSLDKYSDLYSRKIKEIDKKSKELLDKQIQEQKQLEEENKKVFKESMKTLLEKNEDLDGLIVNDSKSLLKYMTDHTIKIDKNRYITPLQKALTEVLSDNYKIAKLALILQNDFDFSDIAKQKESESTRNVKSNLRRNKTTRVTSSKSRSAVALWDKI